MKRQKAQRQKGLFHKLIAHNTEEEVLYGTKICNYLAFEERIKRSVVRERENSHALICLSVSNLEFINSVFGLSSGNNAVQLLGQMIEKQLSENNFATKFATGNYAVFFEFEKMDEVMKWLDDLTRHISDYEYVMQGKYSICVHSGTYQILPGCTLSVKDMIDRSLIAMKKCFGFEKQHIVFEEEMRDKLIKEAEIIKSMDYAMEHGEFKIYLQPQHHLQQEDMVLSAEALVRWVKEDGTIIHPGEFISAFEKNGLIAKLDRHVMELACKFIGQHMNEPWCGNISIAVNVSKVDLKQSDFINYYTKMKNKYHIPDGLIEIEFTESAVFEDYNEFKGIMSELHKNGFSTALDDFGAGSSSLNVLKELPVDVLKMDRMFFVRDESYDQKRDNSVIASVIAMARGLGMKIIAEGIESVEQIDFLRKIGCDIIQGYVYSKPLPVEDFIEYVKNYKPRFLLAPGIPKDFVSAPLKTDNLDILYQNYVNALNYVDAMVMELDMEEDLYRVVSYGNGDVMLPYSNGKFSVFYEEITNYMILPEYREKVAQKCSLSNILVAFYRGDEKIECEFEARIYDRNTGALTSKKAWFEVTVFFHKYADNKITNATIFIKNIQKQKEQELSFVQEEKRLYDIIGEMYVTVIEISPENNYYRLIKNSDQHYDIKSEEQRYDDLIESISKSEMIHPDDLSAILASFSPENMKHILEQNEEFKLEYRLKCQDTYCWREIAVFRKNGLGGALCLIQDIDKKKREQFGWNEKSVIDKLTKTFNKDGFMDNISKFINEGGKEGHHVLLLADIDNFREINQKNGHTFGDMLLCDFVQCMRKINRRDDVIARIGGDEFAIFLKDISPQDLEYKVERIRKVFEDRMEEGKYHVSFSIGAAIYPQDGDEIKTLYTEAFLALERAKRIGNSSFCLYDKEGEDLHTSVEGGEFFTISNRPFSDRNFNTIFKILYDTSNIWKAVPPILRFVGNQYDLSYAFVYNINGDSGEIIGEWKENSLLAQKEICWEGAILKKNPLLLHLMEQGELFACNDIDLLTGSLQREMQKMRLSSIMISPIMKDEMLQGLVGFADCKGTRVWLEEEQETAVLLADMLGTFYRMGDKEGEVKERVTAQLKES